MNKRSNDLLWPILIWLIMFSIVLIIFFNLTGCVSKNETPYVNRETIVTSLKCSDRPYLPTDTAEEPDVDELGDVDDTPEEEEEPEPDFIDEPMSEYEQYEASVAEYISYEVATYDPPTVTVEGQMSGAQFRSAGVVQDENARYTWYSENVLPGGGLTELNANGRTTNEEGFVTDGDGYIAVASGELEMGTVVQTPFGEGKVYDYCETPGTIDIYVSW